MAGRTFSTKGVLIGAAVVVMAITGTRALFDNEIEREGSPLHRSNLREACWWGMIRVEEAMIPALPDQCVPSAVEWSGRAEVKLREAFHVITEMEDRGGLSVARDAGLIAELSYEEIRWKIRQEAFTRNCSEPHPGTSVEAFEDSGEQLNTEAAGEAAGQIYYKVDTEAIGDYRAGQYFMILPDVCDGRNEPWLTPARAGGSESDFHYSVSCLFSGSVPGKSFNVGLDVPESCEGGGRFIDHNSKTGRTLMKGHLLCAIKDPQGRSPSPSHKTGSYHANWELERFRCGGGPFDTSPLED